MTPARNDAKNAQKETVIAGMDTDKALVIVSLRAKRRRRPLLTARWG